MSNHLSLEEVRTRVQAAVDRMPGVPADSFEAYTRYEETAASINDALAYHEFETQEDVELLELYLLKLCELRAMELGVVLNFEG